MSDPSSSLFFNFFLFLLIPFIFALVLKKKNVSPLIGYILGGIVVSNVFKNLVSSDVINSFAYLGIILLLFTVGIEIQFERMLSIKKFIVLGGTLQLGLSMLVVGLISIFFHFSVLQSILIGIAFSSSSTTLVAKIIQDRGEEHSFLGELSIGILMFQDLAFIPFMIIFSSLTSEHMGALDIMYRIGVGIFSSCIILGITYYLGKRIVPYVFNRIASVSRELLNVFIILFVFFIDFLSVLVGVPILVSIFVAGILISQTLTHYHIFTQIRPFRDILAIIFFIYIGTIINVGALVPLLPMIIPFAVLVMFAKALVILLIFLFFRFNSKLSFFLSLFLFQIDEDAFILSTLAHKNNIFGERDYLFIVTTILLSLVMTPLLINNKETIYLFIRSFIKKYLKFLDDYVTHRIDSKQSPIDALQISDHVVICGYGRVGSYVGRALMLANIPFLAIDFNFYTVEKARKEGVNIIYGDPTDVDILDYAELEKAVILIIALPDKFSQEAIILNAKKLNPKIVILTRVHKANDQRRMKDLGVEIVVQPEFEASLSIIRKVLLWQGLSKEEIGNKIRRLKIEHGMV